MNDLVYQRLADVVCPGCVDGDACGDCQAIFDGLKEIETLRADLQQERLVHARTRKEAKLTVDQLEHTYMTDLAALQAQRCGKERCEWRYDECDDKWDTGCGQAHQFTDGGPAANSHRFCPYCGGWLRVKPREAKEGE